MENFSNLCNHSVDSIDELFPGKDYKLINVFVDGKKCVAATCKTKEIFTRSKANEKDGAELYIMVFSEDGVEMIMDFCILGKGVKNYTELYPVYYIPTIAEQVKVNEELTDLAAEIFKLKLSNACLEEKTEYSLIGISDGYVLTVGCNTKIFNTSENLVLDIIQE